MYAMNLMNIWIVIVCRYVVSRIPFSDRVLWQIVFGLGQGHCPCPWLGPGWSVSLQVEKGLEAGLDLLFMECSKLSCR
ncbi:MAG: hypothetical protein H6Q52_827 [Deltaproteobacteria bacterium]|nr:hypothetical protein [Deltaproteobacteria bacterium]